MFESSTEVIKIHLSWPSPSISLPPGPQASTEQGQTIQKVLDTLSIPQLAARKDKRIRPRSNSAQQLALEDGPAANVTEEQNERIMVDVSNLEGSFAAMQQISVSVESKAHLPPVE